MPTAGKKPTNEEVEFTPDGSALDGSPAISEAAKTSEDQEVMTPQYKAAFLHAKKHGNPDKAAHNFARDNNEKEPFASAE